MVLFFGNTLSAQGTSKELNFSKKQIDSLKLVMQKELTKKIVDSLQGYVSLRIKSASDSLTRYKHQISYKDAGGEKTIKSNGSLRKLVINKCKMRKQVIVKEYPLNEEEIARQFQLLATRIKELEKKLEEKDKKN